jgi:hypothetical protein
MLHRRRKECSADSRRGSLFRTAQVFKIERSGERIGRSVLEGVKAGGEVDYWTLPLNFVTKTSERGE